ncbi:MAG: hypothetical protein QF473_40005 [Planctomycetota bacterium]|jgi:hypothetical protein|nr:hypothetical protein [Planctomycetota bacterium]
MTAKANVYCTKCAMKHLAEIGKKLKCVRCGARIRLKGDSNGTGLLKYCLGGLLTLGIAATVLLYAGKERDHSSSSFSEEMIQKVGTVLVTTYIGQKPPEELDLTIHSQLGDGSHAYASVEHEFQKRRVEFYVKFVRLETVDAENQPFSVWKVESLGPPKLNGNSVEENGNSQEEVKWDEIQWVSILHSNAESIVQGLSPD